TPSTSRKRRPPSSKSCKSTWTRAPRWRARRPSPSSSTWPSTKTRARPSPSFSTGPATSEEIFTIPQLRLGLIGEIVKVRLEKSGGRTIEGGSRRLRGSHVSDEVAADRRLETTGADLGPELGGRLLGAADLVGLGARRRQSRRGGQPGPRRADDRRPG